jgi:hypothetical protein
VAAHANLFVRLMAADSAAADLQQPGPRHRARHPVEVYFALSRLTPAAKRCSASGNTPREVMISIN